MRGDVRFTLLASLVLCGVTVAAAQDPSAPDESKSGLEFRWSLRTLRSLPPTADPHPTVAEDAATLAKGRLHAQQKALVRLGAQSDPAADQVLSAQIERYRTRDLPPGLWLDLFEAIRKRGHSLLQAQLADSRRGVEKSADPLAQFQECLEGGDADSGRQIFMKKPEAGCVRCHAVEGLGGQIGPDLTWLRHSVERIAILESVILPNAVIAPGYESALLKLKSGEEVSGVVNSETEDELILTSVVDGRKRKLPVAGIVERTPLPSPMPPGFGLILSKRDIRDLVEFLAAGD